MNIKKKTSGFTLIEIMVAVAIVGILSSIAVPSYIDYVKKSKVPDILVLYDAAKVHLVDYHIKNGAYPNADSKDDRNELIGLAPSESYASDNISELWVGKGSGIIAIRYKDKSISDTGNKNLFLGRVEKKGGRYIWTCNDKSKSWKSTIKNKYLPSRCHN